jgi:serpin B
VLANAIYFKASWQSQFEVGSTQNAPFYKLDGASMDVPFMNQTEGFGVALMDGYKAIDLPYANGSASMLVILPDEGQFEAVQKLLNNAMVDSIYANLQYGQVNLSLPKFNFESSFDLNGALVSLGMTDAFAADRADFSGMTGSRDLYITRVLHKAFVAVDEEGTEAAAATAVIMGLTSAMPGDPIEFKVDRPFIFMIRDSQSGSALFVGRVLEP